MLKFVIRLNHVMSPIGLLSVLVPFDKFLMNHKPDPNLVVKGLADFSYSHMKVA